MVPSEEWNGLIVELHPLAIVRHDLINEAAGFVVGGLVVDGQFANVLAEIVPNGAQNEVVLRIEQLGCAGGFAGIKNGLPQIQQVVEVPLQFLRASADASGAYDDAHAGRDVEFRQGLAQIAAVPEGNSSRDAAGPGVGGHQHHVASRQADKGGDRCPLGATLLLFHLDDEFLPFLEQVLDLLAAALRAGLRGVEVLWGDVLQRQKAALFRAEVDECRL